MNAPTPHIQHDNDALRFLEGLDVSAMKLGLSRIQRLLETLGNPQDSLPMVHIAGTNGKGSVTAMLSSVLKAAGYKVGTFISPHLIHIRERIAINGNPILSDDFQHEVQALKTHLESLNWPRNEWPTYFEFLNVVAYQYFKRKNVDITVFETGLGGRLDSTSVVKHPNITVITTIGMDHMQHLGNTLAKIAAEKAGILKAGSPLVLGSDIPGEARSVILAKADERGIPVVTAKADSLQISPESNPSQGLTILNTESGQGYRLSLLGPYQKNNLAIVLGCVSQLRQQGYAINEEQLQTGLQHTYWPVRFQYFKQEAILLDGSHNPDGFESLQEGLKLYFSDRPFFWMLSLRNNRNPHALAELVQSFPAPLGIITTAAQPTHLYHSADDLAKTLHTLLPGFSGPIEAIDAPIAAFSKLREMQKAAHHQNPLSIITGSLYTAGEILQTLTARSPHA